MKITNPENPIQTLPASLQRLVQILTKALLAGKLTPLSAQELVLSAEIDVKDLMPFADFDHPSEDCYGRKLVYDGGNFEIMVMSWNVGDFSSIHNHGYTEWGVVQVFGSALHHLFAIKNDRLQFARREILTKRQAIKVNNALIHQMGNPTNDPYLTLHVYGCNNRTNDITADAKNFELEHNRIVHTTGGAFFDLPASEIYDFEQGIEPTKEVFLNYASLLLNYYNRQAFSPALHEKKRKLLHQIEEWTLGEPYLNN